MNVFSRIYTNNEWNGIETRSGPGSHREPTRRVAEAIVQLVDWMYASSVTDVACGEGSWMPNLPGYLGIDVAPEAIAAARLNHPGRHYEILDARKEPVPWGELIICRDAMQHLSLEHGKAMLKNMTGITDPTTYLLASTYIDGDNIDIVTGDAYRPNLEAEPFNLPPALLLLHDGYEYHDGDRLRDPSKMLGLWRL